MQTIPGLALLLLALMFLIGSASAQTKVMVQQTTGHLEERDNALYKISGLSKGDMLYVYAKGTSGNFDPMVMLFASGNDLGGSRKLFLSQ